MRIGPVDDDVSKEKKELPNGKTLVKDYVKYDKSQDGYLDSTKFWGDYYLELIYDSDGELLSRSLKKNTFGLEALKDRSKFLLEHEL